MTTQNGSEASGGEGRKLCVRLFETADASQLLSLMKQLAIFEGYIDDFAVTVTDLERFGSAGPQQRFIAWVAERDGVLLGMAVTYVVNWTYDMKTTLVLKELYVDSAARGEGVGQSLMRAVFAYGRTIDAGKVAWTVMQGNTKAEAFYAGLGASRDHKWQNWLFDLSERG